MGSPYVGEIRITGFNFAPVGWAFCDGRLLSIADNSVLFQLIEPPTAAMARPLMPCQICRAACLFIKVVVM